MGTWARLLVCRRSTAGLLAVGTVKVLVRKLRFMGGFFRFASSSLGSGFVSVESPPRKFSSTFSSVEARPGSGFVSVESPPRKFGASFIGAGGLRLRVMGLGLSWISTSVGRCWSWPALG